MKNLKFHKMHGAGNDYVYVNNLDGAIVNPEELSIKVSDRHFGIGSDGLVLIMQSEVADFRMRMFNADGSEAGMCGNASRCVGKYLYDLGLTDKEVIDLETKSGVKILHLTVEEGKVVSVSVDMNPPGLEPKDLPVVADDTKAVDIEVEGCKFTFTCVSMGNPHAVTFIDEDVDSFDVERYGKAVENHPLFPERTNVEFAQVISDKVIRMRVWERGSGETLACGTGACATVVAATINNKIEGEAVVSLLGGEVSVKWDDTVILTGGAEFVFEGEYYL
ncbi:MAG: diaminopimelate epimerase [Rikenellaceae bacterium]